MNIIIKGIQSFKNNGIKVTFGKAKGYFAKAKQNKIAKRKIAKQVSVDETIWTTQRETVFNSDVMFSIVTPLYNTPKKFLCEMIESVIAQSYDKWELCLADGSDSEHSYVADIVATYMVKYPNIKYSKLTDNKGISENTNAALEMATGNYICFFDHDDILHYTVLYEYMSVIDKECVDVLYCDEAIFENELKNIKSITMKPDFAIDNIRCNNYVCHFLCVNKNILSKVGKLIKKYDGAQDFDLVLRISEVTRTIYHVPKVLYFWRMSKTSTAKNFSTKPYASEAGRQAVYDHLKRVNLDGEVEVSPHGPYVYCTKYKLKNNPLISIIISNKDSVDIIKKCVDSILKVSTYPNYEIIIVENNSTTEEIFEYYKDIEKNQRITVLRYDANGVFNYALI